MLYMDSHHSLNENDSNHSEKHWKRHEISKKTKIIFENGSSQYKCLHNEYVTVCTGVTGVSKTSFSSRSSSTGIGNYSIQWNAVLHLQIIYTLMASSWHQCSTVLTNWTFTTRIFPIGLFKEVHGQAEWKMVDRNIVVFWHFCRSVRRLWTVVVEFAPWNLFVVPNWLKGATERHTKLLDMELRCPLLSAYAQNHFKMGLII